MARRTITAREAHEQLYIHSGARGTGLIVSAPGRPIVLMSRGALALRRDGSWAVGTARFDLDHPNATFEADENELVIRYGDTRLRVMWSMYR
jgi:hypothetical protein